MKERESVDRETADIGGLHKAVSDRATKTYCFEASRMNALGNERMKDSLPLNGKRRNKYGLPQRKSIEKSM